MESPVEESPGKLTKKKLKEKTNSASSLKGSMSNSLFNSSNSNTSSNVGRMDTPELSSFQNDHTLSSPSSDGKLSNLVSGLKNHTATPEVNNTSSAKHSKKKSGSESSASGASISGGQGSLTNSTHSEGGSRRGLAHTSRGFSSGSSDAEDEKDKEKKHRLTRRSNAVKPTKPSPLESDDEATDSADEGNSEGEERGRRRRRGDMPGGVLGLRQSNRLMTRKDSSESTNSATSPMIGSALTTSTIFVESALPKEPLVGPGSPVNMAVGYGAAADSMPPPSVFDKTPPHSPLGTPTMDSPKMASDGQRSPGTPIPISPPSVEATERPMSMAGSSTNAAPSGVSLNPVQPSPSLQGSSFNLPFENWVYQAQAVYSPFPLSSSHPGSVATTPVAVESGPYLRTGAPVFLRGTVCQESEGVLIVSVQWRNKTFSGSLIDMNQHEWAPPRLAGDFDEPLTHLKDLCKQQEKRETESQQVNVDVEGDDSSKDTTTGSEKMDSLTKEEEMSGDSAAVLEASAASKNGESKGRVESSNSLPGEQEERMDTNEVRRPKLPRNQSIESELGDMEIVEEPTQGQFQNSSHHKPKLGAAKVSVDSVYSDISDVSDSEEKGKREGSSQPSQSAADRNGVSQVAPFLSSEPPPASHTPRGGSRPKKIPAEEIQHTLPPFSAISTSSPQDPLDKKYDRRLKSKPGEEKDSSDSSASILRSNLLSSYPSTSTTGSVTVSTPNQNHRHSFASNTSEPPTAVTGSKSAMTHVQGMNSSEHPKGHSDLASKPASKSSNFSIESLNACSSGDRKDQKLGHGRSSSPHPLSLKPREHRGRSTSPLRKTKREPPNLPPFNATGAVNQDMPKTTTLDYMPPGPGHRSLGTTADDSDSSGSGSILSTHRKKKSAKQNRKGAEPLLGIKDSKEEPPNIKPPETPALGPIGIHNFNLRIQPISPGIDYSAQQQHMPSSIGKDGPIAPVGVSTPSSLSSPARSPAAARVASPHAATVGEVMGALLTTGSGSTFKEGGMSNLVSVPKSLREAEKGEKESHTKELPLAERRHTGSSSSSSSVSSTSIPGVSLGMPAPGCPLPRVPQGVIQPPPQAIKHDRFKMRSPVPPEMLRQDREENQPPRKRKNSPTTGELGKQHSSLGAEHEDSVNPDGALRGQQQPAHAFQQQGFPPFMPEGEKMDGLPADFSYDPNLPMNIHYQFLSYVNQKKQAQAKEYEDQLKEINRKDREEIERQATHVSLRHQQQQQQQQHQNPRPAKRPRIAEQHHMTAPVVPLQMPHHSPPAKDHSGKQKKPSAHHQPRASAAHMDHIDERHYASSHGQPHAVNIKTEPYDISRHSSHKPPSIVKQPQPHPGQRSQALPNTSSKPSSQKPNQPQSRAVKPDQPFIKAEVGVEQQQHHVPPPGAIPGWPVIPVPYQYSLYQHQQHHQQQQQQQAHSLQTKEAKPKDHKEHKEISQHIALHTQPSAPIVALSQGWPAAAPFMHVHSNILQSAGVSSTERSSRQDHLNAAVTTTTSVITGKDSPGDIHSPSHHRSHRNMGQSSPSSTSKKSSNFDGGSDRRSGAHKMHLGHEHGRSPSSNSVPTSRRTEGSSANLRLGPYSSQADGESRRSNSHPHAHSHSAASSSASSSSSTTQPSGSHSSSSSRSHKSAEYAASTQFQAQAQAVMNAALQQQQQQQSLSSPLPGIQLRQGIPIAPSLVPANWEEWARLQEILQKGQVGIGSADLWQQQMQQMMLAQGVVPIDPAAFQALQQQQQQQQHQNAEQAASALQNLQFLQAAAATGGIQVVHPAMAGAHPAMAGLYDPTAFGNTAAMLPFPMPATAQKRES